MKQQNNKEIEKDELWSFILGILVGTLIISNIWMGEYLL